jgi:hypothetical protein
VHALGDLARGAEIKPPISRARLIERAQPDARRFVGR